MESTNDGLLQQLKQVFELCDEGKRGYISVDQLKDLCKEYLGGGQQDTMQLIACLDPQNHGYVTFPDFCQGVATVLRSQQGESLIDPELCLLHESPLLPPASNVIGMSQQSYGTSPTPGDADSGLVPSSDTSRESPDSETKGDSPCISDAEERYECFGEGDDLEGDGTEIGSHLELNSKPSLSSDSFRSNSSVGSGGSGKGRSHHSSSGLQQRNTWIRNSLRRTSGSSKRISSNALASQLFRGGAPNGHANSSSRRSSLSCDSDEMYTDQLFLEDDVIDLNQKVQLLQQQVTALRESQTNNDDRYVKVKQENAALTARIHSLEEQIRELEIRSEERVREEERRLKEVMLRQEREKNQELEHCANRLYILQQEHLEVKEELLRLRALVEKLKQEKLHLQEQLSDSTAELTSLRDEHQRFQELARREREDYAKERNTSNRLLEQLNADLEDLRQCRQEDAHRSRSPSLAELPSRYQEFERELRQLKEENRSLRETNEELQAQILSTGIQEGRSLLDKNVPSLADEFESYTKEQALTALREKQEDNNKLRAYIDGILLNIMENYPQLLEVKAFSK